MTTLILTITCIVALYTARSERAETEAAVAADNAAHKATYGRGRDRLWLGYGGAANYADYAYGKAA